MVFGECCCIGFLKLTELCKIFCIKTRCIVNFLHRHHEVWKLLETNMIITVIDRSYIYHWIIDVKMKPFGMSRMKKYRVVHNLFIKCNEKYTSIYFLMKGVIISSKSLDKCRLKCCQVYERWSNMMKWFKYITYWLNIDCQANTKKCIFFQKTFN